MWARWWPVTSRLPWPRFQSRTLPRPGSSILHHSGGLNMLHHRIFKSPHLCPSPYSLKAPLSIVPSHCKVWQGQEHLLPHWVCVAKAQQDLLMLACLKSVWAVHRQVAILFTRKVQDLPKFHQPQGVRCSWPLQERQGRWGNVGSLSLTHRLGALFTTWDPRVLWPAALPYPRWAAPVTLPPPTYLLKSAVSFKGNWHAQWYLRSRHKVWLPVWDPRPRRLSVYPLQFHPQAHHSSTQHKEFPTILSHPPAFLWALWKSKYPRNWRKLPPHPQRLHNWGNSAWSITPRGWRA